MLYNGSVFRPVTVGVLGQSEIPSKASTLCT